MFIVTAGHLDTIVLVQLKSGEQVARIGTGPKKGAGMRFTCSAGLQAGVGPLPGGHSPGTAPPADVKTAIYEFGFACFVSSLVSFCFIFHI